MDAVIRVLIQRRIKKVYDLANLPFKIMPRIDGWFTTTFMSGQQIGELRYHKDYDTNEEICTDIRPNDSTRTVFRHKDLRGIDDNCGWTKILDENDLPSSPDNKYMSGKLIDGEDFYIVDFEHSAEQVRDRFAKGKITHYKQSIQGPQY